MRRGRPLSASAAASQVRFEPNLLLSFADLFLPVDPSSNEQSDSEQFLEADEHQYASDAELFSPSSTDAAGFRSIVAGQGVMSIDFTGDPLFEACARGDLHAVDALVGQQPSEDTPNGSLFSTPFGMESIFTRRPSSSVVNRSDAYGRTPLMAALVNSHAPVVSYLVEHGADVNARDKMGMSALQYAVVSCNPITTRALLDAGAKGDYQNPSDGFTPLMMATIGGQDAVVQVLLDAGVDVNARNWKQETSLMYAANTGSELAFRMLLARGADVRAVSSDDCTALTYAAARGKPALCEALAAAAKVQLGVMMPHTPNMLAYATPLEKLGTPTPAVHVAASHGHLSVVSLLIGWGVSANMCRDPQGATALMQAAENGRRAVVEWLIDVGGADVNAQDNNGESALIYACRTAREDVVRVLLSRRAAVNVDSMRSGSPLLVACSMGAVGIVAMLLAHGASLDKPSAFRPVTPLLAAAMNGREDCILLLIQEARRHVVDISYILNARDENGWTALMFAAGRGLYASASLLLSHGANPNIAGVSNGATALMLAATGGRINVIELLMQYNANPHLRTVNGKTAADLARMQRLDKVARVIESLSRTIPDNVLAMRMANLTTGAAAVAAPLMDLSVAPPPSMLPSPAAIAAAIAAGSVPGGLVGGMMHMQPSPVQSQPMMMMQQQQGPPPGAARKPKKAAGATPASAQMSQDRRITSIGKITYNKSVRLGSGSHGTLVYEGFYGGVPAAIKRIPKMETSSAIDAEIKLLLSMLDADDTGKSGSEHVVRYYGKEENEDFCFLAMERMHLTLQKLVHQCRSQLSQLRMYYSCPGIAGMDDAKLQQFAGPLYETVIWLPRAPSRELLRSVLLGVQFLHENSIVHNDLKPGNVLLTADYKVKIADMGLALALSDGQHSFSFRSGDNTGAVPSGLGGYFAPEVLAGERKTVKVDVFAAGCLAYYILTGGFHPFETGGKLKREANIMDGLHDLSRLCAMPLAQDLVCAMIARDPEKRPSLADVLAHPFFCSAQGTMDAFNAALWLPADRQDAIRAALKEGVDGVDGDWTAAVAAAVPTVAFDDLIGSLGLPADIGTDPLGILRCATALADKAMAIDPAVRDAFVAAAAVSRDSDGPTWAPFWDLTMFVPGALAVLFEALPNLPLVVHRAVRASA